MDIRSNYDIVELNLPPNNVATNESGKIEEPEISYSSNKEYQVGRTYLNAILGRTATKEDKRYPSAEGACLEAKTNRVATTALVC